MIYVCLNCYTIFDDMEGEEPDERIKPYADCLSENCTGRMCQIDDCLLDIIIELNKKGYRTFMCCQGHTYTDTTSTHIAFASPQDLPQQAPKGFSVENREPLFHVFKKDYPNKLSKFEMQKRICDVIKELIDWVQELPDNPNGPIQPW